MSEGAIKLTIVAVVMGPILVLGALKAEAGCSGADAKEAQKNATRYLQDLGIKGPMVCQRVDTDGDGYISCTVKDEVTGQLMAFECSGSISWNHGCRLPKVPVRGR